MEIEIFVRGHHGQAWVPAMFDGTHLVNRNGIVFPMCEVEIRYHRTNRIKLLVQRFRAKLLSAGYRSVTLKRLERTFLSPVYTPENS